MQLTQSGGCWLIPALHSSSKRKLKLFPRKADLADPAGGSLESEVREGGVSFSSCKIRQLAPERAFSPGLYSQPTCSLTSSPAPLQVHSLHSHESECYTCLPVMSLPVEKTKQPFPTSPRYIPPRINQALANFPL